MKIRTTTRLTGLVLPGLFWGIGLSTISAAPAPPSLTPLQENVRKALVTIPYLSVFDDLSYRVDNGVVTLFGQVTNPVLKSDAEWAVKRVHESIRGAPQRKARRQALARRGTDYQTSIKCGGCASQHDGG